MSIAQSTSIQAYQLKKGGTPARLAILRMIAADSVNNFNEATRLQPGDWKGARHYGLDSYDAAYCHSLDQGFNGTGRARAPIWYTHGGEHFRNERDADDVLSSLPQGWYTNGDCDETAVGIVAGLSHGRFIAGYRWTSNDERVYFGEVFTDEREAARRADSHAESFAEGCREDDEKYREAKGLEDDTEAAFARLRECLALRHRACMDYVRDEARELMQNIRDNRARLQSEFADYA